MKISIITVAFNAESTIADSVKSVIAQNYTDLEYIIIDGNSKDKTVEIVKSFDWKKMKVISEPDNGIYDAMNKGLKLATGDVIGFLNADDLYYSSDTIETIMNTFIKDKVDSIYGDLIYIDPINTTKIIRYWRSSLFSKNKFYFGWMPPHPTFFTLRQNYVRYGGFRTDFGSAADYELMLRFLVVNNITTKYISKIIVKMRTGGKSNVNLTARLAANKMDLRAWKENNLRPFFALRLFKPLRKIHQYFN